MNTTVKRKPLGELPSHARAAGGSGVLNKTENEMTVEEYLNLQCEEVVRDMQKNTAELIAKLCQEYHDGANTIRALMSATTSTEKKLCVILKVVGGSHIGQKFRLEPATENGEDIFKIGRSTGRLFKEKGVSLYKDKEISTTHAKIEIRNGQVFYVDVRSTNGSQLNGDDVVPNVPLRLNEGDVILLGSTELCVHISDLTGESAEKSDQNDEDENAASV